LSQKAQILCPRSRGKVIQGRQVQSILSSGCIGRRALKSSLRVWKHYVHRQVVFDRAGSRLVGGDENEKTLFSPRSPGQLMAGQHVLPEKGALGKGRLIESRGREGNRLPLPEGGGVTARDENTHSVQLRGLRHQGSKQWRTIGHAKRERGQRTTKSPRPVTQKYPSEKTQKCVKEEQVTQDPARKWSGKGLEKRDQSHTGKKYSHDSRPG